MADTEKFYSLVTKVGQAKISNAISFGNKINFTKMKLGDGNGSYYEPTEDQTDLVNEVYEVNISSVSVDDENPNWIHIEAIIPSNVGGFTVREYGVYDDVDDLIGICKCAETYKPIISDGSTKELLIDMVLCVVNADVIELKIDPTIIYAKKQDIIELRNEIINGNVNIKFERAKGTANNLSLTMPTTLYDGYSKNFIATKDSTTNVKINTNYPLYKQNTTKSPKLTTGKAYTIWFNAVGNNFFLKASAEGDAIAEDVLAGKYFSNYDETGLVGTMPNNPKITKTLKVGESYTVPKGYNNGSVIKAETIKDASKSSGVTLDLAEKLLDGVKAFDKDGNLITGTATIQSMGGKNYYKYNIPDLKTSGLAKKETISSSNFNYYLDLSSLNIGFTPKIIIGYFTDKSSGDILRLVLSVIDSGQTINNFLNIEGRISGNSLSKLYYDYYDPQSYVLDWYSNVDLEFYA